MFVSFQNSSGFVIAVADTRRREAWRDLLDIQRALRPHYEIGSAPGLVVCSRHPIIRQNGIAIHHAPGERAHFSGVYRCANAWLCPLCAPPILQYRREEIASALRILEPGRSYTVSVGPRSRTIPFRSAVLLTYTARHYRSTDPRFFVEAMRASRRSFASSKPLKAYRQASLGYICASEATWASRTGLHFHFHELWFSSALPDEKKLAATWRRACHSEGLKTGSSSFHVRPINVLSLDEAGHYLAKEVAKTKKPLWQSVPPSDLFSVVEALRGRSRIRWSPGLRSALGLHQVLEDSEILEQIKPDLPVVLTVDSLQWSQLVDRGLVPRVLELVERSGASVAQSFIDRACPVVGPVLVTEIS